MNTVQLLGNLTRDPELRYTPNNTAVCVFGIAINEGKDRTTFLDIECWQQTAELVNKYWRKGKQIALTGRLSLDQWDDKQTGQKRSRVKVTAERVFFVGPKDQDAPARQQPAGKPAYSNAAGAVDDSDIPFSYHGIDGRAGA